MKKKQQGMVIDLNRCVGCSACDIACKRENNVPTEFSWSNHMIETKGKFPDVQFRYVPTLCNHCSNAPCVANCPTSAMHKTEDGLTLHDAKKCIGCGTCKLACPYGVIYRNNQKPHVEFQKDKEEIIPGCTSSGKEVCEKTGQPLPYYSEERAETIPGIRPKGIVEKCTLCDHRIGKGKVPACVLACPTTARIFGDLNDPQSPPSKALAKHRAKVLKPEQGTKPNVRYIREYN
jgi:molybdopterin-containing oxidoreductase family iron-sulfur binding subunit